MLVIWALAAKLQHLWVHFGSSRRLRAPHVVENAVTHGFNVIPVAILQAQYIVVHHVVVESREVIAPLLVETLRGLPFNRKRLKNTGT